MYPTNTIPMQDTLRYLASQWRDGYSLPQPLYTSEQVFQADLERVFRRFWLFAGHTTQIPEAGDYFLYGLDRDSIIVVRGDDGAIHAHFNVCRHRGSHLCLEEQGRVKKFVCPYHQWVYEKDGRLLSARLMPEDFDKSGYGLHPVHTHVVEGLIFISLAENPPPIAEISEEYRTHLRPYQLEHSKIAFSKRYDLETNWKLIAENFRECYHCGNGHPEYTAAVIGTTLLEPWERVREVNEERRHHWEQQGLATKTLPFTPETWGHCVRYAFRPGFVSETLDGQPAAPLMGTLKDPDAGVFAIVNLPNFWLEASADYVWTMRVTPVSATRTFVDVWWSVREDAVEGKDYDVESLTAFWKATGEQDWLFCESNMAGIRSTRYTPGPLAPSESEVTTFLKWYMRELLREG